MLTVQVRVFLRDGVKDIAGSAVSKTLRNIGFENITEVRIGKCIEVDLDLDNEDDALAETKKMCEKILANTVIEQYECDIVRVEEEKSDKKDHRAWLRSCWLRLKRKSKELSSD